MWKQDFTLKGLNAMSKSSMSDYLGIEFTDFGEDYLTAKMPVDHRTRQPMGILHGGASAALAETLGSIGSVLCIEDVSTHDVLGLEVSSNHIRSARSGYVKGVCKPIHLGRMLHLWQIKMYDENDKLCCDSKLTVIIKKKA